VKISCSVVGHAYVKNRCFALNRKVMGDEELIVLIYMFN